MVSAPPTYRASTPPPSAYSPSAMFASYRRLHDLAADIQRKKQKVAALTLETARIRTKNATKELQVWRLEDEVAALRERYAAVRANTERLQVYESDSLAALRSNFELSCRHADMEANRRLVLLKEDVSQRVEKHMAEAAERANRQTAQLGDDVAALAAELTKQEAELQLRRGELEAHFSREMVRVDLLAQAQVDEKKARGAAVDAALLDHQNRFRDGETRLDALRAAAAARKTQVAALEGEYAARQKTITEHRESVAATRKRLSEKEAAAEEKRRAVENYVALVTQLQHALPELENKRRQLHGQLQELKGKIRVFCRIRPTNGGQCASFRVPGDEDFTSDGKQVLSISASTPPPSAHLGKERGAAAHVFEFDKVFAPACSNSDVFVEMAQLIQTSLDGANVSVFAYGQTGSGKTWTMMHARDGMVPLSLRQIFAHMARLAEQGWKHYVEGQFVEIYNEQLIDLLAAKPTDRPDIKHDDQAKQTQLVNCTTVTLQSEQHAAQLLETATARRATSATMANSRSSRSHSIFVLKIRGENARTGQKTAGTLNLVDLAGSERLNASQARGDRLRETQAINKSLSCLADVICALRQRHSGTRSAAAVHVPYRNSKLTYLLKHSLGGESKTLMLVNVTPAEENFGETLNSLRFAAKVNDTR